MPWLPPCSTLTFQKISLSVDIFLFLREFNQEDRNDILYQFAFELSCLTLVAA